MRKGFLLSWAGLAVCGLYPAMAQTTSTPSPAPSPAPTVAVPSSTPASDIPSLPGYEQRPSQPTVPKQPAAKEVPPPKPPPDLTPAVEPRPFSAYMPYGVPDEDLPKADVEPDSNGSVYIPLDSWVYPALERLYGLGFIDTMYLSVRPYTRRSVMHMLRESGNAIMRSDSEQAQDILAALLAELSEEKPSNLTSRGAVTGVQQVYDRALYINGQTLRDSYHIGQTFQNDYGRPYEPGFNNIAGASYVAEAGRFSFYFRGEYQHAPSSPNGYGPALFTTLNNIIDQMPTPPPGRADATIPTGFIAAENPFRIVEASLSFHLAGHEFTAGKSDAWQGPAHGSAFAWTNNAENIYSVRINRIEPLKIPLLSRLLGPLRYDFFYGSLKGHTYPNNPYVHSEEASFSPTANFQFGFQRTIIFGGAGHSPVTFSKFLHSFFNFTDTTGAEKQSRDDPGARFTTFTTSYRLPFVRNYATFYVDSMVHDDVTPISAPRRADIRAGLYISQIPALRKLDFRAEGVLTDPRVSRSSGGQFAYFETIQRQGYTNKGYIMGDAIGREGKGGQAWFTYHLSANQYVELEYLRKKNAKDFIFSGSTQDQVKITAVKRFARDYELNAWVQYEKWTAPIYMQGKQTDTSVAVQFSYYPKLHNSYR